MAKLFVTDVKNAEELKPVEDKEEAVPVAVAPQVEEQPGPINPVDEVQDVGVKAAEETPVTPPTIEAPAELTPEVETPAEEQEAPAAADEAPAPVNEAPIATADEAPIEEEVPLAAAADEAPVEEEAIDEPEAPQLTFESVIKDQVQAVREELPYERIPAECFTNTFDCVADPENRCCDFQ